MKLHILVPHTTVPRNSRQIKETNTGNNLANQEPIKQWAPGKQTHLGLEVSFNS